MNPPLFLIGPSGSGKTFIANYLANNHDFELVLSSMTREPRDGEVNMVDNEFLSFEEYDKVEKSGDFFTSLEFFGNKYGYRRSFVENIQKKGKVPILIVFAKYLKLFLKEYPESKVVFLKVMDEDFLRKRLEKRGESDETIQKRLKSAKEEIKEIEENKSFYTKVYEINSDKDAYGIVGEILKIYESEN